MRKYEKRYEKTCRGKLGPWPVEPHSAVEARGEWNRNRREVRLSRFSELEYGRMCHSQIATISSNCEGDEFLFLDGDGSAVSVCELRKLGNLSVSTTVALNRPCDSKFSTRL